MVPSRILSCLLQHRELFGRLHLSTRHYAGAVKMAYNIYESKTPTKAPLVVMHGLFGSKQNWRGISKALAAKSSRNVYAVDARNHGDSPHTEDHGSVNMSADISEFLAAHNMQKAALMGHSMGGRSMMYTALEHPAQVERGIIVDISPISIPRDFFTMELIFKAMQNISVPSSLSMAQGRKEVESQMKREIDDHDTINFIMLNLRKHTETGEFYWAPNVAGLHRNLKGFSKFMSHPKEYPPYEGPMMFICGEHSSFVDPRDWPAIQKIFPNSEIHWLDAGHLVHLEQPAQFVDLVLEFLAK